MSYLNIGCLWTAIYLLLVHKEIAAVLLKEYKSDPQLQMIEYKNYVMIFGLLFIIATVLVWPLSLVITAHDLFYKKGEHK